MERPKCYIDGCDNLAKQSKYKGEVYYRKYCSPHEKVLTGDQEIRRLGDIRRRNKRFFGAVVDTVKPCYCQKCGFIAEHYCQIDTHHIDGDKSNNTPENIIFVCANCHRLITFTERHHSLKYRQTLRPQGEHTPRARRL
jgi:predicted HNH restriction endonuclease